MNVDVNVPGRNKCSVCERSYARLPNFLAGDRGATLNSKSLGETK